MSLVIRRSKPKREYVQIPNATVQDSRLSYRARGVLCELLSRPPGWEATADSIAADSTRNRPEAHEGRRAIRQAFADLEEAGYLKRTKERGERGHWRTVLTVYDMPADDTPGGTSERPAETGVCPGGTDVPLSDDTTGGTSKETRSTNTVKDVPPSAGSRRAAAAASAANGTPFDYERLDGWLLENDASHGDPDEWGTAYNMADKGEPFPKIINKILYERDRAF